MKKLIKWSLIIGLIISLMGVGMITAGAMMGGGNGLASYIRTHHYRLGWYDDDYDYNYEPGRDVSPSSGAVSSDLHRGSSDQGESYENIRKLKVEAAVGTVELKEEYRENPDDTAIRIERYREDGEQIRNYAIRQEKEELKIECKRYGNQAKPYELESIIIYIPEGYLFREVEIETLAGGFYAEVLNANEVDLELRAGEISIGGGRIEYLDVECQAGNLECDALVTGNADVECQAGSVNISLAGRKDQYNYELECKTGSITLVDTEEEAYNSIWKKKYIDHRAGKTVELDCAAGEINIYFPDMV